MDGDSMQLDEKGGQNPPSRRRSSTGGGSNGGRHEIVNGDSSLVFISTVERILSNVDQRGDDHPPQHGPLLQSELSKLSMLCTQHQQSLSRSNYKKAASSSSPSNDTSDIATHTGLGFADVDVEMALELVGYLEKHVALASGVNVVVSTYMEIQRIQDGDAVGNIEEWLADSGADMLQVLSSGLEAAAILLFIVTSPGCDRRVVNEDAIAALIVLLKHNLTFNIIPAVNATGHIVAALSVNKQVSTSKKRRRSSVGLTGTDAIVAQDMKKCYKLITGSITGTILLMERMALLIQQVPLDDQHLITCSAGALAVLELDPSLESYNLQVASMALVTSIFRQYPNMRELMIQDLFPIMLLMPTGKKTIRSFSVQFSPVLFPESVQKLSQSLPGDNVSSGSLVLASSKAQIQPLSAFILSLVQSAAIRPSYEEIEIEDGDEEDLIEGKLHSGLAPCQLASSIFVRHLMHRCSQKGEDGGASDFRPILSNLIDDLLLVLLAPEYPAAEMILLDIVNSISLSINDITARKSRKGGEETYLNTIFDALGKICAAEARIRSWNKNFPIQEMSIVPQNETLRRFNCYCRKEESGEKYMLNCDRCKKWYHGGCVGVSRETQRDTWLCDPCQLGEIVDLERKYNASLGDLGCPAESIDRDYCVRRLLVDQLSLLSGHTGNTGVKDAYRFHLARWLNNMAFADSTDADGETRKEKSSENNAVVSVLLDMWDPSETERDGANSLSGMLQCISDEGRGRMMVDLITNLSGLLRVSSFQSQVGFVLTLLKDQNTKIRKLSLKAIEKIADADPTLMLKPKFQKAVFHRFSDEAVSVREAVVSLVGNYIIQSPELANAFHQAFVVGLADPGISVKKRTVNVLHAVLCNNPSYTGRAEACCLMLRLAADPKEDDTVRDLVHDLFSKIWLENGEDTIEKARVVSPQTNHGATDTPASKASNIEYVGDSSTPGEASIKTTGSIQQSSTPNAWSTISKTNRSTVRRTRNRRLRIRCEVAAEQMVEVVKEADSGEGLTLLFRELTSDVIESDKTKKASARKRRQSLARDQSAMLIDALFDFLLEVEDDQRISKLERGKELVAIFRVIQVFSAVSPSGILKHMDTLLPYLKLENGVGQWHEEDIASSLCPIFSRIIPQLDQQILLKLAKESIGDDLARITMNRGRSATSSAVEALCRLAGHKLASDVANFREKLLRLARTFFSYLEKHKTPVSADQPLTSKAKRNIQRALGVMGSICRFYESSSFETVNGADTDLSLRNVAPLCEKMFLNFFGKGDDEVTRAALRAMVGIFYAHPKEMLRMEQNGLIGKVMGAFSPEAIQLESLHCWRGILLAEEERIESGAAKAKMDSKKNVTLSKKISGDQDSEAILCGGILTEHAARIFEMTSSRDDSIRFAAVDLTGHLLRQGQLNPNDAVPHMLAVQGDVEEGIRRRALQIIMIEGQKRPELVRQRLYSGIKRSYLFQKAVYPDIEEVNALITVWREGREEKECVFGSVYKECIASQKKQRRSLLQNLVRVFDLSAMTSSTKSKKKGWLVDLELLSYTSQVLAYLPYGFVSDVLFVIRRSDTIITKTGNDVLERISSFLRDSGLAGKESFGGECDEGDIIAQAAKRHAPHHAKAATARLDASFDAIEFAKLCNEAGSIILLLRLKSFLQQMYGLSEAKCHQFDPDKKLTEKAISKAITSVLFPSKLPMQGMELNDNNDILDGAILQCEEFRQLMRVEHRQVASVVEGLATPETGDVEESEEFPGSENEEIIEGESGTPISKRRRSSTTK